MQELLLLNFIIPVTLLLVSVLLKRGHHPYPGPAINQVKWKVDFSGYNTPGSRKSQAHWDYANAIAPVCMRKNGLLALAAAGICSIIGLLWEVAATFPLWCVGFLFMGRAFRQVERALKNEFGP